MNSLPLEICEEIMTYAWKPHPCAEMIKKAIEKIRDIVYEGYEEDVCDPKDIEDCKSNWGYILEDTLYQLIMDTQFESIVSYYCGYQFEIEYIQPFSHYGHCSIQKCIHNTEITNYKYCSLLKYIWDVPPYKKKYIENF